MKLRLESRPIGKSNIKDFVLLYNKNRDKKIKIVDKNKIDTKNRQYITFIDLNLKKDI